MRFALDQVQADKTVSGDELREEWQRLAPAWIQVRFEKAASKLKSAALGGALRFNFVGRAHSLDISAEMPDARV